jgi:hypothetical protein
MLLPNNYTIVTAAGSQWSTVVTVYNDDGTPADITNKVFEFVTRDRLNSASTILFSFTSSAPNAYGQMIVNVINSTVQVVISPVATLTVIEGGGPYTLWMNQNLSDATALLTGVLYANPVTKP